MSVNPWSVAVGIPAYHNQVHTGHLYQASSMAGFACINKLQMTLNLANSSSLDWSRNMLLFAAIDQGAAWCLMCDSDTYLPDAKLIYRMIADGIKQDAAVIAAPVKMRGRDGHNVQVKNPDGSPRFLEESEFRGKIVPVDHIGTALFAIRCGWIQKHWPAEDVRAEKAPPWFQTHQAMAKLPIKYGEDFYFCKGVRSAGGLILCDGRLDPAHAEATSETAVLVQTLNATVFELDERLPEPQLMGTVEQAA